MAGIRIRGGMAVENPVEQYPGITTIPFPECPAVSETRSGSQVTGLIGPMENETWDLDGAEWDCKTTFEVGDPFPEPVRSDLVERSCILGGTIIGPIPEGESRQNWYHGNPGPRHGGDGVNLMLDTSVPDNWVLVRDMFINDFEDAYDAQGVLPGRQDQTLYLDHVQGISIGDDAMEIEGAANLPDGPVSLHINNSYFQSYTGIAFRPPGSVTAQFGSGAVTFTMENSLMWIVPLEVGSEECGPTRVAQGRCVETLDPDVWLACYGIWKWSNQAPSRVALRNCIFRLDLPSYSSCQSQRWPAGVFENVTLVWTGPGDYEDAGAVCTNVLPPGVTLTTDVSVWDDALAAWEAQ